MFNLDSRGTEMWLTVEAAPAVLAKSHYPLQHLHCLSFIIKNIHNTCDFPLAPPPPARSTGPVVWTQFRVSLSKLCIQSYVSKSHKQSSLYWALVIRWRVKMRNLKRLRDLSLKLIACEDQIIFIYFFVPKLCFYVFILIYDLISMMDVF